MRRIFARRSGRRISSSRICRRTPSRIGISARARTRTASRATALAGAIAASGLLELADLLPAKEGRAYRAAAERMLTSLYERYATWDLADHEAILLQGTGHKPAGQNVNVSLIYGDYFFVEAVAKLNGWTRRIF